MPSLLARMLLLPSVILAVSLSHAQAYRLEEREATESAAIHVSPDDTFNGIDGSWSTFTLSIGTPAQYVKTLISWAGYQTWVVGPQGCESAADYQACATSRGGIFTISKSRTWDNVGIYDLNIEGNLGYEGNAEFGYDTVGLGGAGVQGPTVKNTTVGSFALTDFYMGIFGLNPEPTNFTTRKDPSPSYLSSLKEQNIIPSVSFGYTAGAQYRFSGETASLTLGGYDASRFIDNNVQFHFPRTSNSDIIVAIQSINTPSQIKSSPSPTEMLPGAIYAYLDATVPQIWLPLEACKAFEYEFGLVYDNATELYLVNNTLHQSLLERNASVTFKIAQGLTSAETMSITLPYAAFDLTATPPYQSLSTSSRYFPLRRAANETQYTIGRTFFQEAYLSVDYESQVFNVSQCLWNQNAQRQLVAIPPSAGYNPGVYGHSNSLSGGAIAGIVIGVLAGLALIGLAIWFCLRRRRNRSKKHQVLGSETGSTNGNSSPTSNPEMVQQGNVIPKAELVGSPVATTLNERDDQQLLAANGLVSAGASSGSSISRHSPLARTTFNNNTTTRTTHSPSADFPTYASYTGTGTGTHSSTSASSSNGNNTAISSVPATPLSPSDGPALTNFPTNAETKPHNNIFEMAGDMPPIREKDGHELSEKEALAHRERVYNGVDSAPTSAYPSDASSHQRLGRVNSEDVVTTVDTTPGSMEWPLFATETSRARGDDGSGSEGVGYGRIRHRPFSFEERSVKNEGEGEREEEGSGSGSNYSTMNGEELYS